MITLTIGTKSIGIIIPIKIELEKSGKGKAINHSKDPSILKNKYYFHLQIYCKT